MPTIQEPQSFEENLERVIRFRRDTAEMLAAISEKRVGRVDLLFLVQTLPKLWELDERALFAVLTEALEDERDRSLTLATFWQPARKYCRVHGLPDPDQLGRLRDLLDLEGWQPSRCALVN